jgi:CubicO group peptidase (beta-lactamase class C family)
MDSSIRAATFEKTDYSVASEPALEPDEWMRRLGELPLSYQPGERWQYDLSNEVICVLVARVTGQSFETFLRERILDPLGMKDTGYHVPASGVPRLRACLHRRRLPRLLPDAVEREDAQERTDSV